MRLSFFKLARAAGAAFCQIFLDAPIDIIIARNKIRNSERSQEDQIPEKCLLDIYNAMEPPCPEKHPWESHTVSIDRSQIEMPKADTPTEVLAVDSAWRCVRAAWVSPPAPKVEMTEEERRKLDVKRAASRLANCNSAGKLADASTRKLLGEAMRSLPSGVDKGQFSKRLNLSRKALMNQLKTRSLPGLEIGFYDQEVSAIAGSVVGMFSLSVAKETAAFRQNEEA
jgi:tRNA uridine 5-carbamoylmethylation protein Kti12